MSNYLDFASIRIFNSLRIDQKLLIVSAFALPFMQKLSILCWGLSAVIALISFFNKKTTIKFSISFPTILLPLLYLLLIAGLLWTDNLKMGGKIMEEKLTLVLLPLIFMFIPMEKSSTYFVKLAFVFGCIITCMSMEVIAISNFLKNGDQSVYFYTSFSSVFGHPTYISMYINLCLLFLLEFYLYQNFIKLKGAYFIVLNLLFILCLIQLSARTSQATTLVTYALALFYFRRNAKITYLNKIHFVSIVLFTLFSFVGSQKLYTRIKEEVAPKEGFTSTSSRFEVWKESVSLLKEYWIIGAGTGDIKDVLMVGYEKNNFQYGLKHKLNPHNEFLQIWLSVGILGFLIYLLALIYPIWQFVFKPEFCLSLFPIIIFLNSLTESILETQNGILFFSFFYVLFYQVFNAKLEENILVDGQ
jgi:O-antigen ligase